MNERDDGADRPRRWQRREKRRRGERERIQKHGAGIKRVYPDAIRKRLRRKSGG
jgi:hypothetical protein